MECGRKAIGARDRGASTPRTASLGTGTIPVAQGHCGRTKGRAPLVALFILSLAASGYAQHYPFKFYSVEDGLVQSGVTQLYQDSRGFIWVCTMGGVSRFSGNSFTNLTRQNGLPGEMVYTVAEDNHGFLWFGTNRGLCRYDGASFLHFDREDGLPGETVFALHFDSRGVLWVGTDKGVCIYRDQRFKVLPITRETGRVVCFAEDPQGVIWIGAGHTLYRHDPSQGEVFEAVDISFPRNIGSLIVTHEGLWISGADGLSSYDGERTRKLLELEGPFGFGVRATTVDSRGRIWMGASDGIYCYEGGRFRKFDKQNGLPGVIFPTLMEDREGNIWFGTGGAGIGRFNDTFILEDHRSGLGSDLVLSFTKDHDGNLWIGTTSGVTRFDGQAFRNFRREDGLAGNIVRDSTIDSQGNLWFATLKGPCRYDGDSFQIYAEANGVAMDLCEAIYADSQDRIWIGLGANLACYENDSFRTYTEADGLGEGEIWSIYEDRNQHLWLATSRGVYLYGGGSFHFLRRLGTRFVSSITEDKNGNLWFGLYGEGIVRLPINEHEEIESFRAVDGLSNDVVYSLLFDHQGYLWVGTNKGINRIDVPAFERRGQKIIKHYGRNEGFLGIECNRNAIFEEEDGSLLFGTIKGLIRYRPDRDRVNDHEPLTYITNVRLFAEEMPWKKITGRPVTLEGLPANLKLPHDSNHLTFDFVGISTTSPERVSYRYQLKGFDDQLSPVVTHRSATYSNLPPGSYTFLVAACNNDGLWNQTPARFSFHIAPPIWRTWWFTTSYLFIALLLAIIGLAYYKRRLKVKAEKNFNQKLVIQQKQKMESLGRLASGVSHDFNKMLASIMGFNSLAMSETQRESQTFNYLSEVQNTCERARELIKQILLFSRQGKPKMVPVPMYRVTLESLRLAAVSFPEGIALEKDLDPKAGWVLGESTQMHQVILNLCSNASQAIGPKGGLIEVALNVRVLEARREDAEPGTYVVLTVRDNGAGMDEETRVRIFEPFFTTKRVGEGTGMGLSVVLGIVTSKKGFITVTSALGKGAIFEIWLPRLADEIQDHCKRVPTSPPDSPGSKPQRESASSSQPPVGDFDLAARGGSGGTAG